MLKEQRDNGIKIKRLILGDVRTNCYIVGNEEGRAIIIDPADSPGIIADHIERENLKPVAILLTHGHFDHIMAADRLRTKYGIKIYAHRDEKELMLDGDKNLSSVFTPEEFSLEGDEFFEDGDGYNAVLQIEGFNITAIHTPGHTPGSVSYMISGILFSGDTLFLGTHGRTDFPGGSTRMMLDSIKNRLFKLDDGVEVYPGHDDMTTIGKEKAQY